MTRRLYTIYDKIAEESGPLFEAINDGVAMRKYSSFLDEHNTPRDEFRLFHVGQFDHDKCTLEPNIEPVTVQATLSMVDEGDENE